MRRTYGSLKNKQACSWFRLTSPWQVLPGRGGVSKVYVHHSVRQNPSKAGWLLQGSSDLQEPPAVPRAAGAVRPGYRWTVPQAAAVVRRNRLRYQNSDPDYR